MLGLCRQGRPRFDKSLTAELQARLKPLIRETQPYAKKIAHRGIWVARERIIQYLASHHLSIYLPQRHRLRATTMKLSANRPGTLIDQAGIFKWLDQNFTETWKQWTRPRKIAVRPAVHDLKSLLCQNSRKLI
jgi:hypothetical protein